MGKQYFRLNFDKRNLVKLKENNNGQDVLSIKIRHAEYANEEAVLQIKETDVLGEKDKIEQMLTEIGNLIGLEVYDPEKPIAPPNKINDGQLYIIRANGLVENNDAYSRLVPERICRCVDHGDDNYVYCIPRYGAVSFKRNGERFATMHLPGSYNECPECGKKYDFEVDLDRVRDLENRPKPPTTPLSKAAQSFRTRMRERAETKETTSKNMSLLTLAIDNVVHLLKEAGFKVNVDEEGRDSTDELVQTCIDASNKTTDKSPAPVVDTGELKDSLTESHSAEMERKLHEVENPFA